MFLVINGGGTTFKLGVYDEISGFLLEKKEIATKPPSQLMPILIQYIQRQCSTYAITAIGAAMFGPLELNPLADNFGSITSTDKKGWVDFAFYEALKKAFPSLPIGIHNDLCAAGMAEYRAMQLDKKNLRDLLYFSIGTGVGAAFIQQGKPIYGKSHPELGHISIAKLPNDTLKGVCSYHGDCLEGLASGPALALRAHQMTAKNIPESHAAWDFEIDYIAQALANYSMIFSPSQIILNGGVMMDNPWLIKKIEFSMKIKLNGYYPPSPLCNAYLKRDAELYGAAILAEEKIYPKNQVNKKKKALKFTDSVT